MADGGIPPRVSAIHSLQHAWGRLLDNAGVLLTLSFILFLFDSPWTFIRFVWDATPYSAEWWLWYGSGALVSFFLITPFRFGFLWSALQVARGKPAHFEHFTRGFRHYFAIIAGSFLYGLSVVVGLLLFVLPGIYLAARMGLFPYRIMAGHAGPVAALKQSWALTKGHTASLLVYGVLFVLVSIAGALTFGILALVLFPYLFLAYGALYHQIAEPEPADTERVATVASAEPGDAAPA